jgi:hypothetical protein
MTSCSTSPNFAPPTAWHVVRRWSANAVIVCWLLIAIHQAAPFVPERVHKAGRLNQIARTLGIWQSRWPMFAPEPTSHNQSLEAIVTFADGSTDTWRSPDWREVGPGERFLRAREPKLYENLQSTLWSPVWPAFSQEIASEVRQRDPSRPSPKKVELYLDVSRIDPPEERWRPWRERAPVSERHLFHMEELP